MKIMAMGEMFDITYILYDIPLQNLRGGVHPPIAPLPHIRHCISVY